MIYCAVLVVERSKRPFVYNAAWVSMGSKRFFAAIIINVRIGLILLVQKKYLII